MSDESLLRETQRAMKKSSKRLKNLLDSGEFSDFTVIVEAPSEQTQKIKVHKCVLIGFEYFRAAIFLDMKEGDVNELLIKDFEYDVVLAMVYFMYTSRVKPTMWYLAEDLLKISDKVRFLSDISASYFVQVVLLFIYFTKYGLRELADMCAKELEAEC